MQRKTQIHTLLSESFAVSHMELTNESHMHSVPPNSETHFKVVMVSEDFEGLAKVKRHQQIYKVLSSLMQEGLHALALHLYTPTEWQSVHGNVPASPDCQGGSKSTA